MLFILLDFINLWDYNPGMAKIIAVYGKRPADATREAGIALRTKGLTYEQIGKIWNVSRARVFQIINKKQS